jgi:hypothetical protein
VPGSRYVRIGLPLLALGVVLLVLLYPTDEKRVLAVAEAIVEAANQDEVELGRALEAHASPNVYVIISGRPEPLEGRAALVAAAGRSRAMGQKLSFRMEQPEVSVQGGHARLTADLVAVLHLGLRQHREARRATALFDKEGGRFVLTSAEVGVERQDQPEARP